jgi:hypothetical protein
MMSADEYHGHPVQSALGHSISGHSHAGGFLPHDHEENIAELERQLAEAVKGLTLIRNTPHPGNKYPIRVAHETLTRIEALQQGKGP